MIAPPPSQRHYDALRTKIDMWLTTYSEKPWRFIGLYGGPYNGDPKGDNFI